MKDKLGEKATKGFMGLRPKTYSYEQMTMIKIKVNNKNKCVIKGNIKFQDYKICLEATELENEILHLNNNKTLVRIFIENYKELIKNNKIILKSQQRFKRERHNAFIEEINRIALSSNVARRIHPTDSIETYMETAYGTKKDLIHKKDEINCENILKPYKK